MARKGVENSEVRAMLVDAACELIQDEGCHAVTARRLSERVGLKRQIVHYYFGTLDELFIAVLEKLGEGSRQRFLHALASEAPLRVTWEQAHDSSATLFEFITLAMQRESIRDVLKRYMDEFRQMQAEALEKFMQDRGIRSALSPVVTTLIVASISQALSVERALGVTMGHEETNALIGAWLDALESGEGDKDLLASVMR